MFNIYIFKLSENLFLKFTIFTIFKLGKLLTIQPSYHEIYDFNIYIYIYINDSKLIYLSFII